MKFTAQVGGLLKGLKPVLVVATKGILKDYQLGGLVTLNVVNGYIQAIADGGKVSATNEIGNDTYNIDYVCDMDGVVTVNAVDLENALSSFAPSDKVSCELVNGSTVRISSITDSDEVQTMPIVGTPCQFHDINADGQKPTKLSIRRDIFQNYASKIMFAYGDQEQYKQFTYWVLRSFGTNSLRFVSGTGTIFAVAEVDGANMTDAKGDIKILFPNEQTTILLGMLKELTCDKILIESGERYICITCGAIRVNIYSCDPNVEWPDENRFLKRDSKYKLTTKAVNWKNAIKGILATNNVDLKEENKVHNCVLNIDLTKKIINTKTDHTLKSSRKVPIEDIGTNETAKEVKINCVSKYMSEIINRSNDEEYLQFEIEDANQPVVVRHYADPKGVGNYLAFNKPSEDGLQERYSVFFATLKE